MPRRTDLNSLTPADRTVLVNLILRYINDAVLASHFPGITHTGGALFTGHRIFLEGMEAYLASHGGGRFVPLPKWNPATRIPDEFFPVVKPRDDGTPRPPLTNQTPNLPLPARFASPAVCSYANADQLGNDINGWHGSVHGAVGGTMTDISNSPAAPIFWPWHAFIDDVYYDWQQ